MTLVTGSGRDGLEAQILAKIKSPDRRQGGPGLLHRRGGPIGAAMSERLELEQLPAAAGEPRAGRHQRGDLRRLSAVPVDLSVEMGRTRMTVGETLELRQGSIITLNRMAGEPVDLLVNGTRDRARRGRRDRRAVRPARHRSARPGVAGEGADGRRRRRGRRAAVVARRLPPHRRAVVLDHARSR